MCLGCFKKQMTLPLTSCGSLWQEERLLESESRACDRARSTRRLSACATPTPTSFKEIMWTGQIPIPKLQCRSRHSKMSSDGVNDDIGFVEDIGERDDDAANDLPTRGHPNSAPSSDDDDGDEDDNKTAVRIGPNMNKKRSHEEMNAELQEPFPSSATVVGDIVSSTPYATALEQPASVKTSTAARTSIEPQLPGASSMAPPSTMSVSPMMPPPSRRTPQAQQTPPSGQGSQKATNLPSRPSKPEVDHSQKASQPQQEETPEPEEPADSPTDPDGPLADFEWRALHERYHDTMTKLNQQECDVMKEFAQLCDVRCTPSKLLFYTNTKSVLQRLVESWRGS